jgi:hypothetical protein
MPPWSQRVIHKLKTSVTHGIEELAWIHSPALLHSFSLINSVLRTSKGSWGTYALLLSTMVPSTTIAGKRDRQWPCAVVDRRRMIALLLVLWHCAACGVCDERSKTSVFGVEIDKPYSWWVVLKPKTALTHGIQGACARSLPSPLHFFAFGLINSICER